MSPFAAELGILHQGEQYLHEERALSIAGLRIMVVADRRPLVIPYGTRLYFEDTRAPNTVGKELIQQGVADMRTLAAGLRYARAVSFDPSTSIRIETYHHPATIITSAPVASVVQLFIAQTPDDVVLLPMVGDSETWVNGEPLARPFSLSPNAQFIADGIR